MGCNPWDNKLTTSCIAYQPGDGSGVTIDFTEYPQSPVRTDGSYNIPSREGSAVMYPSIVLCGSPIVNNSPGNCGKLNRTVPHNNFGSDPCEFFYDYYPTELSFDYGYSDRWFAYIFDTSNNQGVIGKPCYYYETEESSTTGGASDSSSSDGQCFPCSAFTCTPAATTLSYTMEKAAMTDDPDCPHPTVFGFGSDKNKLAFTYDSLSTTLPNGVTDFSFAYASTYVDAWNQSEVTGIAYDSGQNPPYQSGDESFTDFTIFEIQDIPNNKVGLRIKIETKSLYDDSGASTVFTGTQWLATEVLNPGTGYAVNDVFPLTYTHTHPDNSTSTLTVNLKITGVGPVNQGGAGNFWYTNPASLAWRITDSGGTQITNSLLKKGTWVQVGTSNNPNNGWTQHMKDYGIYPVVPLDTEVDPYIGTWQTHTTTVNFATSGTYSMRIESDNYSYIKITDPSGTVILDREVVYNNTSGVGEETISLTLGAGTYTVETRIKNLTVSAGVDILRAGDTINGHTITRAFHTDLDNFLYHIIYLDGAGSDFTKNTQYTSSRNHVIQAVAGYGVKDRAILIGMYEFLEKSIQFTTADIDKNAPDVYNTLKQPDVTPTIVGGIITKLTLNDGGSGWNSYGRVPEVQISPPAVSSGTQATCKAEFTGGVMSAIKIDVRGSGYSSTNLPTVYIKNIHKKETLKFQNEIDKNTITDRSVELMRSLPEDPLGEISVSAEEEKKGTDQIDQIQQDLIVQNEVPNFKVKLDPNRQRIDKLPQRMYSKSNTDPFKAETAIKYDLKYLGDVEIPRNYKDEFTKESDRSAQMRLDDIEAVTQEQIPEYANHDECFVETVQGPTSALPHASTYTKYMLRQYRPDPTKDTNLNVTLSCTPVNSGCAHFSCGQPAAQSGSSVTNDDGSTTTTTYVMSGMLGDGCKAWTATGKLRMWNDMTSSTIQFANATTAYGNPFSQ